MFFPCPSQALFDDGLVGPFPNCFESEQSRPHWNSAEVMIVVFWVLRNLLRCWVSWSYSYRGTTFPLPSVAFLSNSVSRSYSGSGCMVLLVVACLCSFGLFRNYSLVVYEKAVAALLVISSDL